MTKLTDFYFADRKRIISLAIFRIIVGLTCALDIAINWGSRQVSWHPDGVNSLALSQGGAYLDVSLVFGTVIGSDIFLVVYALVCLVFAAGWGGVVTKGVFVVCTVILHQRSGLLLHGGDNLVKVLLPMILMCKLDGAFSLKGLGPEALQRLPDLLPQSALRFFHNVGVVYGVAQLCVLYGVSAVFKLMGPSWLDGTAVYYISRVPAYNLWPEITSLWGEHLLVINAITYVSMLTQLLFPVSVLVPWLRLVNTPVLVGMHMGIAVLMGLPTFSLLMIAGDMLVVSNAEWRAVRDRLQRRARHRGQPTAAVTDQ